jgi:hypothetical protein
LFYPFTKRKKGCQFFTRRSPLPWLVFRVTTFE